MRRGSLSAFSLLVAVTVTGCAQDLSVHVRVGPRPPNPDSTTPVYVDRGSTTMPAGYVIDRFQIVLRNVRLQSDPTVAGEPSPDMRVLIPGPILVDLSGGQLADGAFTSILEGYGIGARAFYEVDIDLAPVTDGDVTANPALASLLGQTFVIAGKLPDGRAFTFSSSLTSVLLRPSVYRFGLNHNNITINVATNLWFLGPDAVPIDPTNPAERSVLEENVRGSIDAYEDANLNGVPDPLA
jgi:hypothetical protein